LKAIILAGGFGTRLRPVVSDVPKPMAPVRQKPFLELLLTRLSRQGVTDVTLALGYLHQVVTGYFGNSFNGVPLRYVVEETPLGTGGAIQNAISLFHDSEPVFVFNGDTLLDVDLKSFLRGYETSCADVGIVLKHVADAARYGRVVLDRNGTGVERFEEKGICAPGFINAGVYLVCKHFFSRFALSGKFSLEVDCFSKRVGEIKFFPYITEGYFIDIGVPEDYERAADELVI
jgi:D-glycero-alpha-D-manno-heptose 1-phosphate guanylyltransferase